MKELLAEYRESLKLTQKMREDAPEEDQKIHASMQSELEFIIKWLKDGQQPAPKKERITLFSKPEYVDKVDLPSACNFNGDPFEEVENLIDAARRKRRDKCS